MPRTYLNRAEDYYKAWRRWQKIWTMTNLLLGGTSVFLGTLVAVSTKVDLLPPELRFGVAIAVPILTFMLTSLKPQAEAVAFKTASRELEKALVEYIGDESIDDSHLVAAVSRGIDILNKVKS